MRSRGKAPEPVVVDSTAWLLDSGFAEFLLLHTAEIRYMAMFGYTFLHGVYNACGNLWTASSWNEIVHNVIPLFAYVPTVYCSSCWLCLFHMLDLLLLTIYVSFSTPHQDASCLALFLPTLVHRTNLCP